MQVSRYDLQPQLSNFSSHFIRTGGIIDRKIFQQFRIFPPGIPTSIPSSPLELPNLGKLIRKFEWNWRWKYYNANHDSYSLHIYFPGCAVISRSAPMAPHRVCSLLFMYAQRRSRKRVGSLRTVKFS